MATKEEPCDIWQFMCEFIELDIECSFGYACDSAGVTWDDCRVMWIFQGVDKRIEKETIFIRVKLNIDKQYMFKSGRDYMWILPGVEEQRDWISVREDVVFIVAGIWRMQEGDA